MFVIIIIKVINIEKRFILKTGMGLWTTKGPYIINITQIYNLIILLPPLLSHYTDSFPIAPLHIMSQKWLPLPLIAWSHVWTAP